jgi:hypothetical protein
MVGFMVFNATFNNILVISWWSGLLARKPEYLAKTIDLTQVTDKPYVFSNVYKTLGIVRK